VSPARKKTPEVSEPDLRPLNRKYRPQSFDAAELVGQEHIVRTLKNAVRSNRLASAYLFCGPRGTGKTSTARILAKAANCLEPDPEKRPCNACSSCDAINKGSTPDVVEIDAASNRGIDDIRDLRERAVYAPTQLRTKFYIIDEAHQITGPAANAFLKTLEEPPAKTKFILATTDPEELLPTILSRCQRFDFRRHTPEVIAQRVRTLAEREGIGLSDDAISLVADLAHGSLRDPIGLLDQLASYRPHGGAADTELTAEDVRELVGITRSEVAVRILSAIAGKDAKTALESINEAVERGQDPRQLNRQLVGLIRDGLYLVSGAKQLEDLPDFRLACERLSLNGLLDAARAFADTDFNIRNAVIPQLPLEMAVLEAIIGEERPVEREPANEVNRAAPESADRGAAPPDAHLAASARSSDEPSKPRTPLRDMVRNSPEPRQVQETSESLASTPPVAANNGFGKGATNSPAVEALAELWPKIRADIKSLDRRTEALLGEIDPVHINDDEVILAASYEFHRDKVNEDERRAVVESVIARRLGRTVRVQCVLRSDFVISANVPSAQTQVATEAAPPVPVESGATETERSDEKMLGAVVRMFDGEVFDD
jgi:DNA polymerase III subunit gamma/tau